MSIFKRGVMLIVLIPVFISANVCSSEAINYNSWNKCTTTYVLLKDGVESNSAVKCAMVKTQSDYDSNRIHLLFLLTLKTGNDISLAGLNLRFNSFGDITLGCDGTSDYDNEVYFAEMETEYDNDSNTMYMETTVGIKDGIPDSVIMTVSFVDTDGIKSNEYTVDITPGAEDVSDFSAVSKNAKTTKAKKAKTTKEKTSKKKTTRKGDSDEEEKSEIVSMTELRDEDVSIEDNKSTVLKIVGASAVALGVMGTGIMAVRKRKNDN